MNRRDAIGVMGGLLTLPSIKLTFARERDLSALVTEFTGVPDRYERYDLTAPWECEGQSVATDAFGLIAVPGLDYVHTGDRWKRPELERVFKMHWREAGWLRVPCERLTDHSIYNAVNCPYCARLGCPTCGLEDDWCETCHGNTVYRKECSFCHGKPTRRWIEAGFGVARIDVRYGRLVRQIPGVRWLPPADDKSPLLFRGDGGVRAMVMPMSA